MTAMSERRFESERRSGSRACRAVGVVTQVEDERRGFRIDFDGQRIPGLCELPPMRARRARLEACVRDQPGRLVRPPHRRGDGQ
jgi:hypothetical protein